MVTCTNCGTDVTGKKFCPNCGTPVHLAAQATNAPAMMACPRCGGEVSTSAAFCMHCGTALKAQENQGQLVQVQQSQQPAYQAYPQYQDPSNQQQYNQQQYNQQPQYPQPQYDPAQYQQPQYNQYNQGNYQQPQYPQYPQYPQQQYQQPQYNQQYQQPQYGQYNQGGYQQQPMTLRCPVCMAMAPLGTSNCPSCHTSLAGVVPTPANMAPQGQQGGLGLGGLFQGNNGKMAMGALGGAAAVLGGEALLHGIEGNVENRGDDDMGMGFGYDGYERRHHHRREEEGLLGGLGDIANDLGL